MARRRLANEIDLSDSTSQELLRFDYENTLKFIDKSDEFLFRIRNWAIVTTSGIIAYAIQNSTAIILILAILGILGFLTLELIYKSFHEDALGRSYDLEKLLQRVLDKNYSVDKYEFGIGHAIQPPRLGRLLRIVASSRRWHLIFPYFFLFLAIIVAYIYVSGWNPLQCPFIAKPS